MTVETSSLQEKEEDAFTCSLNSMFTKYDYRYD